MGIFEKQEGHKEGESQKRRTLSVQVPEEAAEDGIRSTGGLWQREISLPWDGPMFGIHFNVGSHMG